MARPKISKKVMDYFREEGRKGGLKSAPARMRKLTPEKRSEVGRKAAAARWGNKKKKEKAA